VAQELFRGLDKSLRRKKIMDQAIELFRKKGYRTTTLDDLARALGVTKAALYHYVESKDDLLLKIFHQALEAIFKETHRIASLELPPELKLREIIRNHIQEIIINHQSLMFVFFTEENQLPRKYYRMVRQKKAEYDRILQEIIQAGIREGVFAEGDPRLLSYAIIGMSNWVYHWYQEGIPYTPDRIADFFIGILERGYLSGTPQKGVMESGGPKIGKKAGREKTVYRKLRKLSKEMATLLEHPGHT
jgi:AcrR family transcriptional regulator